MFAWSHVLGKDRSVHMFVQNVQRKPKGIWPVIISSQRPTHFLQLGSTSLRLQNHTKQCNTSHQTLKICVGDTQFKLITLLFWSICPSPPFSCHVGLHLLWLSPTPPLYFWVRQQEQGFCHCTAYPKTPEHLSRVCALCQSLGKEEELGSSMLTSPSLPEESSLLSPSIAKMNGDRAASFIKYE